MEGRVGVADGDMIGDEVIVVGFVWVLVLVLMERSMDGTSGVI